MTPEAGPGIPVEASENEYTLSLREPLRRPLQVIQTRLWIIVLVTGVLAGTVVGFNLLQTPIYEASIKILVGQDQKNVTGDLAGNVQGLQQVARTVAEGANSRPVAEAVIEEENLRMTPQAFLNNLSVEQISATQFIQVGYRDPSPERAQQVANAFGEVFSKRVSEVSPSANPITATVWEPAVVPDSPASPKPMLYGLLGLMLGLILGVGLAFLLEYLDDSWRSPEEAERVSGVPTFGVIPNFEASTSKKVRY